MIKSQFSIEVPWVVSTLRHNEFIEYGQVEGEPMWLGRIDDCWEYECVLFARPLGDFYRHIKYGAPSHYRIWQPPGGVCCYGEKGRYCSVSPRDGRFEYRDKYKPVTKETDGWHLLRGNTWRTIAYMKDLPHELLACPKCEAVKKWEMALCHLGIDRGDESIISTSAEYDQFVPDSPFNRFVSALQIIYLESNGIGNGRATIKKMKYRKEFRRTTDRILRELLDLGIVTLEPSLKTTYINYKKDLDPLVALEVLTWYGKGS